MHNETKLCHWVSPPRVNFWGTRCECLQLVTIFLIPITLSYELPLSDEGKKRKVTTAGERKSGAWYWCFDDWRVLTAGVTVAASMPGAGAAGELVEAISFHEKRQLEERRLYDRFRRNMSVRTFENIEEKLWKKNLLLVWTAPLWNDCIWPPAAGANAVAWRHFFVFHIHGNHRKHDARTPQLWKRSVDFTVTFCCSTCCRPSFFPERLAVHLVNEMKVYLFCAYALCCLALSRAGEHGHQHDGSKSFMDHAHDSE